MTTRVLHKPEYSNQATLEAFDAVIRKVQENGISPDELAQLKVKWRSDYYSTLEGGRGGYTPKYGFRHLPPSLSPFSPKPPLSTTTPYPLPSPPLPPPPAAPPKYLRTK